MQYLLLLHADESGWAAMTPAEQQSGAMVGANRLQPASTATTTRVVDGKAEVHDGPFVDTKEQLGGYYLIEAPDLDAALAWAQRCPGAHHGSIEVRPVWAMD